jgi:hypothetical protein
MPPRVQSSHLGGSCRHVGIEGGHQSIKASGYLVPESLRTAGEETPESSVLSRDVERETVRQEPPGGPGPAIGAVTPFANQTMVWDPGFDVTIAWPRTGG